MRESFSFVDFLHSLFSLRHRTGYWTNYGMKMVKTNATTTVCAASHIVMSSFAVIMEPYYEEVLKNVHTQHSFFMLQSWPKVAGAQRKMAANVLCHPFKALLVNHPVNENDSPLPPEQCWILKIRHWVGRIVPQCQVIEPISRDKSKLYGGGRGRQRTKKYSNYAIRSNSFGSHCS